MERLMLSVMYEIPERTDVSAVLITEDSVNEIAKPVLVTKEPLLSNENVSQRVLPS